jgi:hypothetical protein
MISIINEQDSRESILMSDECKLELYDEIRKDNPSLRLAIWKAHKKICAFYGDPLDFNDFEIDHIYPEKPTDGSISQNVIDFMDKKFAEGFIINCAANYLPVKGGPNKRKGNRLMNPTNIAAYFELAERMFPKVQMEYSAAKKAKDINKYVASLALVNWDDNARKILFSTIEEGFTPKVDFNNKKSNPYAVSIGVTTKVSLRAYISKDPNNIVSCLIKFSYPDISGCKILLDDDMVKRNLFSGRGNTLNDGGRNFVIHRGDDELPQTVQLGNIRLDISRVVLQQLCDVIDLFHDNYDECRRQTIDAIGAGDFPYQHKGYKIASIPKELWNAMLCLSRRNVNEYSSGEWVWFSSSLNVKCDLIEVLSHPDYRKAHNLKKSCHFKLKSIKNYYTELYDIFWQSGSDDYSTVSLSLYNNRELWKVDFASEWFVTQAIPMALSVTDLSEKEKSCCSFDLLLSKNRFYKHSRDYYTEEYGIVFY